LKEHRFTPVFFADANLVSTTLEADGCSLVHGLTAKSPAPGLDRCGAWAGGPLDVALIVLVFFVGELATSRLFFAVGLRDRPY
jgi:hypothetical protein